MQNITMRPLTVTITGDSAEEVVSKLRDLCKQFGIETNTSATADAAGEQTVGKKSGKKSAKAETTEAAPTATAEASGPQQSVGLVADPQNSISAQVVAPALKDVQEALQSVISKKGLPVATQVLAQFNAKSLSKLDVAQYQAAIDACKAKLALA